MRPVTATTRAKSTPVPQQPQKNLSELNWILAMPDSLFFTATTLGDSPVVYTGATTFSRRELDTKITAITHALARRGYTKGDRIAVWSTSIFDCVCLLPALLRLGAVAVPVSTRFPAVQVSSLLEGIGCTALITDTPKAFLGTPFTVLSLSDYTDTPENFSVDLQDAVSAESDATILFTSGSTGTPKAVLHSLDAHLYSARGSQENIPLAPGDTWLLSLPLYHIGGYAILIRTLLYGAAVAIPQAGESLREALLRYPITHLSLVSTQLYRLLQDAEAMEKLRTLTTILLGGSAIPPPLIERALAAGLPIHTSYGCTEMASQVTTTQHCTMNELLTSGKLLPFRELCIDTTGEILVRGNTLFRGFVQGKNIKSAVDEAGWYHTRDTGYIGERGLLHVTGRLDNMFISGGENIQPEEIEQILAAFPGVLQSLVVPVADAEFGERPVAFVWLAPESTFSVEAVREFLAERLARFKIPLHFFLEPPPEENAGKLNRRLYRERAVAIISTL